MYEPEKYDKVNQGIGHAAEMALRRRGGLIRWKPDHSDVILDIGCGTGNVLMDVVLPAFEGKYSLCFGTDISQSMVDFAADKYGHRTDVIFQTMDVYKANEFVDNYGRVDHVISSFAIHWLTDLDTGFRGIYELLKPGGDFFSDHVASSFFFDVYASIGDHKRWGRYFPDIGQFEAASNRSQTPAADLEDQLRGIGFVDVTVDVMPVRLQLRDMASVRKLINSVHAQIYKVPQDELEEYIDYLVDFAFRRGGLTRREDGLFEHHLKAFIVYAQKPEEEDVICN